MEITKFQLKDYDPSKPNDAQLADDWRLVAAKYSTMKDGGKTEFGSVNDAEQFAIKVLEEILKRGKITFHPENTKPPSLELLVKSLGNLIKGGLYLTTPHGELIFENKKSAIVKSREFERLESFNILVSGKGAYGFIRFKKPEKINLEQFKQTEPKHKISDEERIKWWPSKTELYIYEIRDFIPYIKPRPVRIETGAQVFIDRVRFIKRDDSILLIPDFVCQVGSSVTSEDEAKDKDILFRLDPCEHNEQLRESLTLLIRKHFDPRKKDLPLHYIFNASGPHDDFLPLFDLRLFPKQSKVVEIGKRIIPGKRFDVMKPAMVGTTDFFNTDELWENWAKEKLDKHKLVGQVKYDGFRCILSKNGKVLAWFEDSKEDRADDIPDIVNAVKGLPSFVVDCEITAEKEGRPIPRTQLMTLLAGKLEATLVAHVFDCLYWSGEDLSDKSYSERYKYAQKFVSQVS